MTRNVLQIALTVALLFALVSPQVWAMDGSPRPVKTPLRLGMETTKPVNDLDRYGSKAMYNIEDYARAKPVYNMSTFSRMAVKPAFNISQRTGQVGRFSFNTGQFRPLYNVSAYSRTKPLVEIPAHSRLKPLYNVAGYPEMKMAASIP